MASRARKDDQARAALQRKRDEDWRRRHPEKAREERGFRKTRAELEKAFASRDKLSDGGTPETRAKAARVSQGALARLYERGHISIEQMAAGQQIRSAAERIVADVKIGSFSLETRVDGSPRIGGAFFEALSAVRAELAYSRWRAAIPFPAPVLAMVVEDLSCRAAARRWRMRDAKAIELLTKALDLWNDCLGEACKEVDEASLLAAQAGLF